MPRDLWGKPGEGGGPQLFDQVRKEAYGPVARCSILAQLSPVLGGMQPGFIDPMRVAARLAMDTKPLLVIGARDSTVKDLPGVAPPGILSRVSIRAGPPIMGLSLGAPGNFEAKHPEVIREKELWMERLA